MGCARRGARCGAAFSQPNSTVGHLVRTIWSCAAFPVGPLPKCPPYGHRGPFNCGDLDSVPSLSYPKGLNLSLKLLLRGAHQTPCARRANVWPSPRVMASAELPSPRGRTQCPYALLKPWPWSGPPPVSSARMHANIGRRAARRANTPPMGTDSARLATLVVCVAAVLRRRLFG